MPNQNETAKLDSTFSLAQLSFKVAKTFDLVDYDFLSRHLTSGQNRSIQVQATQGRELSVVLLREKAPIGGTLKYTLGNARALTADGVQVIDKNGLAEFRESNARTISVAWSKADGEDETPDETVVEVILGYELPKPDDDGDAVDGDAVDGDAVDDDAVDDDAVDDDAVDDDADDDDADDGDADDIA